MFPKDFTFRMPAEWEAHTRTMISWPVQASMCYPHYYHQVCHGYTQIIKAIAEFEPVTLLVNPWEEHEIRPLFDKQKIDILPIEHNDSWLRDNGPTFVVNDQGEVAGINWRFNAWGRKFSPWDLDDQVSSQILKRWKLRQFDAPIVLEGGSIHVDGQGTLITTEECLLNMNRNPALSQEQLKESLKKYIGIKKIIWLKRGLIDDDTDGHIDNVACFAAPGKILLQICRDPQDEQYAISQENLHILRHSTDALGRRFEIIPIEQPPAKIDQGSRLPLSYINFYLVNGGLILPIFGETATETDQAAQNVLRQVFPDRQIRTIDGMAIIREGGNVHCITQQVPRGRYSITVNRRRDLS